MKIKRECDIFIQMNKLKVKSIYTCIYTIEPRLLAIRYDNK